VVLFALPPVVHAQEFRHVELNLFAAGSSHTKNEFVIGFPQSATPINEEFKLSSAIRGGLRFNVNTTGHWGEEFFFSYEPNTAHFARTTPPQLEENFDIRVFNFGINAMYYLNEEESQRTRPFVSFGFGGTTYQPTFAAKEEAQNPFQGNIPGFGSSTEFAMNYGIGFKRDWRENYGFRMDLRGFLGRSPSFSLPRSSSNPAEVVFPATGAIHNLEASAGIIFKLKR